MTIKKIILAGSLFVFVASLFLLLHYLQQPTSPHTQPVTDSVAQQNGQTYSPLPPSEPSVLATEEELSQTEKLQSYFNSRFSGKLDNPYWQLKILENMLQLFKQLYPDSWQEEMLAFIRSSYPNLADVLIQKFDALNEYMQWLADLEHSLEFTDDADRIRAMWDKRLALFGEEAYVIWEAAYKDQQFETSISSLQGSSAPFAQKVDEYKAIFKEVHGVDVSSPEQKHKTQIITRFLTLDNVQADLQALPPVQRKQQLREFRQAMGLDQQALDRWETLDTERDQQRSASERYATERAGLEEKLSGVELDQAINDLQNQLFGESEAAFIRNEEAAGFHRFEQQQQYGIN